MQKLKLHFQRFEFKYYLSKDTADKLIPILFKHMEYDFYIKRSNRDYYIVNSLYFDSPGFGSFWDKESGVSSRKKLRFRFYEDIIDSNTPVFVELKRKKDALVIKDRIKLHAPDCFNNSFDSKLNKLLERKKENNFLQELFWFKKRNSMKLKLFVSYKRKALVGKIDKSLRVTFDFDIKSQLSSSLENLPQRFKDIYSEGVILELKYNNILPAWFHNVIQKHQLQ